MKVLILILVCAAGVLGGCVEREMTLTSDPPGAIVFVSGKEIGCTPVTQSFLWYGDYEIILRRKGYKTLETHRNIKAPFYETIPLDLLSAIAPWTIHDRRYLHFEMEKLVLPDDQTLIGRADELRRKNSEKVEK